MSFFLKNFDDNLPIDESKVMMASIQFDAMNKSFNTMLYSCMEKCIKHEGYAEGDLTKGEMTCLDRCVAKIHYANRLIGGYLQTQPGFQPQNILRHYNDLLEKLEKECRPVK